MTEATPSADDQNVHTTTTPTATRPTATTPTAETATAGMTVAMSDAPTSGTNGIMTGVVGQPGRVMVSAAGNLMLVRQGPRRGPGVGALLGRLVRRGGTPTSGRTTDTPRLDWYIAAEDRWHVPANETAVRQRRIDGTPVTETRVRVPNGDVVQRVYTVGDLGGITIVEIENESTLSVAVAFGQRRVLTERPIPTTPIEGIDVPDGAFALPLGHKTMIRVGFPHSDDVETPGLLPKVPTSDEVVRGWVSTINRAGAIEMPDSAAPLSEAIVAARSDLILAGIDLVDDHPAGFLLGLDQLMRMGVASTPAELDPWVVDIANAIGRLSRDRTWLADAAFVAAQRLLLVAEERRAADDVASAIARHHLGESDGSGSTALPTRWDELSPIETVAWAERTMVSGVELLPSGVPAGWEGQSFGCKGLPTLPQHSAGQREQAVGEQLTPESLPRVSYAIRWHGEHPAVLWEQHGGPFTLVSPVTSPAWSSAEPKGEALWHGRS